MLPDLLEVSADRDAMRRSVERTKVRKAMFDVIWDVANDICDRYSIGMCGGPENASGD